MPNTASRPTSPLKRYLKRTGLSQRAFAEAFGSWRGHPIGQTGIGHWASGYRLPGPLTQLQLERYTEGAITRRAWRAYAKRRSARATGGANAAACAG